MNQRKPRPAPRTAPQQDRELAGAGHVVDLQIIGEHRVAGQIRDHAEARGGDHHRHDGKPIETVGEVHRVAGADDDEDREQHVEPAEIDHQLLEEGKHQRGRERRAAEVDKGDAGRRRNRRFDAEPRQAGKAFVRLLGDFQIVVVEADHAETERHPQHDPDVGVGRIGPQHRRDQHAGQNHQAAHRRRAGFGDDVGLRSVGADRLAFALQRAQPVDDGRTEQEHEQQRGDDRAAGAKRDVAEDVEDGDFVRQIDQPIEHRINLVRTRPATCLLPTRQFPTRQFPSRLGARTTVAAP